MGQRIGNLWIPEVDRKPKERLSSSKPLLELAPEVSQADLLRLGVLRLFLRAPTPHITREVWQCPRCGKNRAKLYWLADGSVGCRTDEPGMAYLSERDLRRPSVAPERIAELVKRAAETTNPSMRKKRLTKAEKAAEEFEAVREARHLRVQFVLHQKMARAFAALAHGEDVLGSDPQWQRDEALLHEMTEAAEGKVRQLREKAQAKVRKPAT
jgi:hypothetical protein